MADHGHPAEISARALGAHVSGDTLWLAVADGTGLVDIGDDYRLVLPTALESGAALIAARDDLVRILTRHQVERVRLLSAENKQRDPMTYHGLVPRITIETVLAFAAAHASIDFLRVSRPSVRAVLGLPQGGQLNDLAADVTAKVTPHWGPRKRDLATVTALAGVKEQ